MTIDTWTPEALPEDAVELGRLGDAWGIKGWIKIHPYSADPEALLSAEQWWLQPPVPPHDRNFKAFTGTVRVAVDEIKPHADTLVARLAGVADRNASEALRGARIWVPRSAFPESSDPDEFYWVDLVGLTVVNREGVELGSVTDLLATGPTSVLVVGYTHEDKPAERLIPFVSAYVDGVDKAAGRITVDWQPDY
jgi:16S rRNA processing protein RimM